MVQTAFIIATPSPAPTISHTETITTPTPTQQVIEKPVEKKLQPSTNKIQELENRIKELENRPPIVIVQTPSPTPIEATPTPRNLQPKNEFQVRRAASVPELQVIQYKIYNGIAISEDTTFPYKFSIKQYWLEGAYDSYVDPGDSEFRPLTNTRLEITYGNRKYQNLTDSDGLFLVNFYPAYLSSRSLDNKIKVKIIELEQEIEYRLFQN